MRRLSIAQKLLIICAAFLLPLLVQLTIMLQGFQEQIDNAEAERAGNLYLAPVRVLLTRVPEHGRLVHLAVTGTAGLDAQVKALATEIDAAFGTLAAGTLRQRRAFRLEAKELAAAGRERTDPEGIRSRWEQVHSAWRRTGVEANDKAHRELAQDLNLLLQHVGESSGLYLDPDLDSFYVMDASIRALQRVHAQIALALLLGTTAKADAPWPDDVRGRLYAVGQQLRDVNLARVREEVTAALREDSRFYGVSELFQRDVPPRLADFTAAVGQFVGLMEDAYKDPSRTPSPARFLDDGEKARLSGAALWDSLSAALDDLLLRRVAYHRSRRLWSLVLSFLALAVAAAMVASVARGITRPLDRVMDVAARLSTGDVAGARSMASVLGDAAATEDDRDRDEVWRLARAFSSMARDLGSLLGQVGQTARRIAESAGRISSTARKLDEAVLQQATATTEVSATSREIARNVGQVAESMARLNVMVGEAAELADAGRVGVSDIEGVMRSQLDAIGTITGRLAAIRKTTDSIATVVKAITGIAEQVNLLSLNAAIEAEKAGSSGAGFAVVAREMRRLADRAGRSALEVREMAESMHHVVNDGVTAADGYAEMTRAGSTTVGLLGEKLRGIIDRTRDLAPHIEKVDGSVHLQSESARHLSEAMQQLAGVTLETRAASREFAAVIAELGQATRDLDGELERFRIAD